MKIIATLVIRIKTFSGPEEVVGGGFVVRIKGVWGFGTHSNLALQRCPWQQQKSPLTSSSSLSSKHSSDSEHSCPLIASIIQIKTSNFPKIYLHDQN